MICFPNAKINLGLNITEKRSDGFHNLESVFYPVGWTDALEIVISDKFEFNLTGISVEGNKEDNLCVKVYQSLKEKYNLAPVKMHLHKNIPVGAGLGGGSADAAFTAKLLNEIFNLNLSIEEMQNIVRPLGSDCAFFIENKPVYAFEKGDQFKNIELNLIGKYIVMAYPDLHISTKEAYSGIKPQKPTFNILDTIKQDIGSWKEKLVNDFENGIIQKYPIIEQLKNEFYKAGAIYASMSGSGSTVFGIFDMEIETNNMFPKNYKIWQGNFSL